MIYVLQCSYPYPKFDELCLLAEVHQPDIVCIVETWLDHNISDNEIRLSGYQFYSHHDGGVLMYAQHNLMHCECVTLTTSEQCTSQPGILTISVRYNERHVCQLSS